MDGGSDDRVDATLLAEATDLTKRWADGAGLQPLSFTLSSSELVVVRGRSGSGKSTLLSLLAGWISPDAAARSTGPMGEAGGRANVAWNSRSCRR